MLADLRSRRLHEFADIMLGEFSIRQDLVDEACADASTLEEVKPSIANLRTCARQIGKLKDQTDASVAHEKACKQVTQCIEKCDNALSLVQFRCSKRIHRLQTELETQLSQHQALFARFRELDKSRQDTGSWAGGRFCNSHYIETSSSSLEGSVEFDDCDVDIKSLEDMNPETALRAISKQVKTIDDKLAIVGGERGSWRQDEHDQFVAIVSQRNLKPEDSALLCSMLFPTRQAAEVRRHFDHIDAVQQLQQVKRNLVAQWKLHKTKLRSKLVREGEDLANKMRLQRLSKNKEQNDSEETKQRIKMWKKEQQDALQRVVRENQRKQRRKQAAANARVKQTKEEVVREAVQRRHKLLSRSRALAAKRSHCNVRSTDAPVSEVQKLRIKQSEEQMLERRRQLLVRAKGKIGHRHRRIQELVQACKKAYDIKHGEQRRNCFASSTASLDSREQANKQSAREIGEATKGRLQQRHQRQAPALLVQQSPIRATPAWRRGL
ncbi:MAG: hypothetical protein MHM6MM_000745 [Cercozoa sp. M6MM]